MKYPEFNPENQRMGINMIIMMRKLTGGLTEMMGTSLPPDAVALNAQTEVIFQQMLKVMELHDNNAPKEEVEAAYLLQCEMSEAIKERVPKFMADQLEIMEELQKLADSDPEMNSLISESSSIVERTMDEFATAPRIELLKN